MRLYVPLRLDEYESLRQLAREERRRPQDQAALLIIQALPKAIASDGTEPLLRQDQEATSSAV